MWPLGNDPSRAGARENKNMKAMSRMSRSRERLSPSAGSATTIGSGCRGVDHRQGVAVCRLLGLVAFSGFGGCQGMIGPIWPPRGHATSSCGSPVSILKGQVRATQVQQALKAGRRAKGGPDPSVERQETVDADVHTACRARRHAHSTFAV